MIVGLIWCFAWFVGGGLLGFGLCGLSENGWGSIPSPQYYRHSYTNDDGEEVWYYSRAPYPWPRPERTPATLDAHEPPLYAGELEEWPTFKYPYKWGPIQNPRWKGRAE